MDRIRQNWLWVALIIGTASGYAAFLTYRFEVGATIENLEKSIVYLPGIVFGLFSAVYFALVLRLGIVKLTLWIITSTLSFTAAYWTWVTIFNNGGSLSVSNNVANTLLFSFPFAFAGCIGASVLIIGFHLFIFKLDTRTILMALFTGALIPAILVISGQLIFYLFIPWQTAILYIFARRINSKNVTKLNQLTN